MALTQYVTVKPQGNMYMDKSNNILRKGIQQINFCSIFPILIGLGNLAVLEDYVIVEILYKLDAKSLACMQATSKAFYIFTSYEEVWKALTLQEFKMNITFHANWQQTFKSNYISCENKYQQINEDSIQYSQDKAYPQQQTQQDQYNFDHSNNKTNGQVYKLNNNKKISLPSSLQKIGSNNDKYNQHDISNENGKVQISNGLKVQEKEKEKQFCLYSDYLYRSKFCATCPIPDDWLEYQNIPRVKIKELGIEKFKQLYLLKNRPAIITDIISGWPAYKKWNRQYLLKKLGDNKVHVGGFDTTIDKYFKYADEQQDELPMYLFDKKVLDLNLAQNKENIMAHSKEEKKFSQDQITLPSSSNGFLNKKRKLNENQQKMQNDVIYRLCDDYTVPECFSEDLFQILDTRPDYRWLIIGPEKSGSTWHIDPNGTSAWNGIISGSKKWILYPPKKVPPGVYSSQDMREVAQPVSMVEWLLSFYDETKQDRESNIPHECIVNKGDILFVPHSWWHMALNLEQDTIAITQNFVCQENVKNVMKILSSNDMELISGIDNKERLGLYKSFKRKLEEHNINFEDQTVQPKEVNRSTKVNPFRKDVDKSNTFKFSFF